ncbi:MAG: hypothetical protein R3C18_17785 [Planctomycetaceae bacterium]
MSAGEVLIYYANETAPVDLELENYQTFAKWLSEMDTEKTRKMARALLADAEEFPAAVDREIETLQEATRSGAINLPVMIFTNRLARQNLCQVLRPGQAPQDVSFEIRKTGLLVEDGNPLCRREALEQAVALAAELFPPKEHEFVLITKSHGSATQALTVRLQRDFREFSREKLEALLEAPETEVPVLMGVTKPELFDVLAKAGHQQGMEFRAVFIESCRGTFDVSTMQQFPENIQQLFASGDRFLEYQTLDYPQLVQTVAESDRFSTALKQQLGDKYLAIRRDSSSTSWQTWLWFLPAALFAGLWARSRVRPVSDASEV